jgi:hypothetical protein
VNKLRNLLILLFLIPSLSWGLTFKDGKQVDGNDNSTKNSILNKKSDIDDKECSLKEEFPTSDLKSDKFIFTSTDYHKIITDIPMYIQNTKGSLNPDDGDLMEPRIILVEDFNNDKIDDLLIEYTATWVAPVVAYGQSNGKFKILKLQETEPNAARKSIRKAVAEDFNKDGFMDIYGFTTGDHYQEKGISEKDILLLNEGGKGFKSIDIPESRKNASNHGGFLIDINNDGWVDIVPLDEYDGEGSYPIKNINGSDYDLQKKHISNDIKKFWIEDGDSGDLNGDGYEDMVVTIEEFSETHPMERNKAGTLRIVYGDGDFDFSNNKEAKLGTTWVREENLEEIERIFGESITSGSSNVSLIDINADNKLDILVGEYIDSETKSWHTSGFKVYINKEGCFSDETNLYFPNQFSNRKVKNEAFTKFIGKFFYVDLNEDGFKDLILRNWISDTYFDKSMTDTYPYIFINHDNANYYPLPFKNGYVFRTLHSLSPGDFNGDGKIDIIGIDDSKGNPEIATFLYDSSKKDKNNSISSIKDGVYELSWYAKFPDQEKEELLGKDEVLIESNNLKFIDLSKSLLDISANYRKEIEFFQDGLNIIIIGNLDLMSPDSRFVVLTGKKELIDGYYELNGQWHKDIITVRLTLLNN